MALKFHFKSSVVTYMLYVLHSSDMSMFVLMGKYFKITTKKDNAKTMHHVCFMDFSNPHHIVRKVWSWGLSCQRMMQHQSKDLPFNGTQQDTFGSLNFIFFRRIQYQVLFEVLIQTDLSKLNTCVIFLELGKKKPSIFKRDILMSRVNLSVLSLQP